MTPQQFIAKWHRSELGERSAYQQHFLDLCELLEQPKPADADPTGAWYTFERGVRKTGGGDGWADVWMRGHFGWEYKGKHKNLAAAYQQLLLYREDLENPPLLVVCDLDRFEIHTNFTGTVKRVHAFDLDGLSRPENLDILRKLFTEPHALRPEQTAVGVTEAAAGQFGMLADALRQRGVAAPDAAHFLMKLMFCFFAEDVELLPEKIFTSLLGKCKKDPQRLSKLLGGLFDAMRQGGDFGADTIAYFNGGLFADAAVIDLRPDEIERLISISAFDWSCVEPSVFGTLFERTLDPDKRAQVGAQYTSKEDILTIVEPVLMAPLRRQWAEVRAQCDTLWEDVQKAARKKAGARGESPARKKHDKLIQDFVERLAHVQVLDPACGSGNFLYVAIRLLLDLEKEVIAFGADRGLSLIPHVRPTQLHGIEILPYAHQLAQVVIWIGYLQWMRQNGFVAPRNPVLEPIESIVRMDAILDLSDPDEPREPEWPQADVIIGNPPFLGGKLLRTHLGDEYIDRLFEVWDGRVPREADLCCYWFEKARQAIQNRAATARERSGRPRTAAANRAGLACVRAGLLATQGIRGGANREVLKRIKETGDIFFAVSDRDWILDGANVHISMVGFDDGSEPTRFLDGQPAPKVTSNLTSAFDSASAGKIHENLGIYQRSPEKGAKFEISRDLAMQFLKSLNPNGRSNSDVLHPWVNAEDLTTGRYDQWIIDFNSIATEEEAAQFEQPFEYIRATVYTVRMKNRDPRVRKLWWRFRRSGEGVRNAAMQLRRFLCTPMVAKHRLFVWLATSIQPDKTVPVFARDDDYFFGVLHSAVHERWSRRMGTQLREAESGCRYTPTTCFETFPFPPLAGGIGKEVPPTDDFPGAPEDYDPGRARRLRERIAAAAAKLHELRDQWLNPVGPDGAPALSEAQLKRHTLTNLYNERPTWLELAHLELDRAVLAAYGWPEDWADKLQPNRDPRGRVNPILGVADPAVEQELLAGLLALNLTGNAADRRPVGNRRGQKRHS